ncbi:MAG: AsmA family protein [Deltaproteobacteria bacterium]|nr:AsmA family protein [Deltaproteobacteria bacterium]
MRRKMIVGVLAGIILACFLVIIVVVSTYDYNKFKPMITGIAKKYTGRKLTIAGDIKVKISLSPTLEANQVSFQNAPWSAYPEMIRAKRIEVQLALIPLIQGKIDVKRLTLINPDVMMEINTSGKTNLEFDFPEQRKVETAPVKQDEKETALFDFNEILIKDGKLTVKNHQKNKTFVLTIDRGVEKSADFMGDADIELKGSFNDIPFNVSGKIGSLAGIADPDVSYPVDLKADVAKIKFSISGKIQDPVAAKGIDVRFSVKGDDLAKIENIIRKPLPIKGPFHISSHLLAAKLEKIQVSDLLIELGNSKLNGSVTLDRAAEKPKISGNLVSDTLDLRPMLIKRVKKAPIAKEKTTEPKRKSDRLFQNTPLKLDGLHRFNAAVDVRIKHMLLPRFAFDNIETKVRLQDGNLTVNPLTAFIGGGKLVNSLNVQAKENMAFVDVNVDIKQMNLGEMLKKLEITQALEGILDLDINLKGQGKSTAAIMAGLNGDVIASLGEGKIPTGYLDFLSADISSTLMRLINPFGKKIDNARINCAVCDFNIKNGMAKSDIIVVDDPHKTSFSKGKINLKTEELDFHIETKPKEGIGTQDTGKLSISLSGITKPFKLGGTLTHPSLEIDIVGSGTTIGAALLGPVGWAYLLVSGSSGKANPCKKALEISGKGAAGTTSKTGKEKEVTSGSKEKKQGIGDRILNIFK